MEAEKVQQTPPDPNSITQRKGAFIKTAHQYGQLYEWRKAQNGRFHRKAIPPIHQRHPKGRPTPTRTAPERKQPW